jgi:hypothetical protein
MLNPNLKEIKVVPNCTSYDLKFYSGRIEETRTDFLEVASKYKEFGTEFYQKTYHPISPKDKPFTIPGGIICPKVFVRKKTIEEKVELEKVDPSELRSDDRELIRYVIEDLEQKNWMEVK